MNTANTDIFKKLFEFGKFVLTQWEPQEIFFEAVDMCSKACPDSQVSIIFFDGQKPDIFSSGEVQHGDGKPAHFSVPFSLISRIYRRGNAVFAKNPADVIRPAENNRKTSDQDISIYCLPIKYKSASLGLLYMELPERNPALTMEGLYLFRAIPEFIALTAQRYVDMQKQQSISWLNENVLREKYDFSNIIGHHPKLVNALRIAAQVAETNATVLIQGETGTGKELIARCIHENSRRKSQPFVAINCAALPETLLESELFGHMRGAFTGAVKDSPGWFESAEGGSIFLDEINEMPVSLQVKLLRVLQTGEYSPIGSREVRKSNIRFIGATTRELRELIREKKFREELFYRLNVVNIFLPPLRNRKSDILLLANHFLDVYSREYQKAGLNLSPEAKMFLFSYGFPGNIRELENMIERAVILCEKNEIGIAQLPVDLKSNQPPEESAMRPIPFKTAKKNVVENFEREYIIECLRVHSGNIKKGAELAGIHVKNFYDKMTRYNINPHLYKLGKKQT